MFHRISPTSINLILEEILIQSTMAEFKRSLSYATLDLVFECDDIKIIFNSSFNTYLWFYSSFPLLTINNVMHTNSWITIHIKTSSKRKRGLYITSRKSNNSLIKKITKLAVKYWLIVLRKLKDYVMIIRYPIPLTKLKQHGR